MRANDLSSSHQALHTLGGPHAHQGTIGVPDTLSRNAQADTEHLQPRPLHTKCQPHSQDCQPLFLGSLGDAKGEEASRVRMQLEKEETVSGQWSSSTSKCGREIVSLPHCGLKGGQNIQGGLSSPLPAPRPEESYLVTRSPSLWQ